MIARTKERYSLSNGNIMLMWGYLTVGISALVWVLLALTHNPAVNWLWFLIWIIGGIATPIMAKKEAVKKGVKTYTDKIIDRLWSIVGFQRNHVHICMSWTFARLWCGFLECNVCFRIDNCSICGDCKRDSSQRILLRIWWCAWLGRRYLSGMLHRRQRAVGSLMGHASVHRGVCQYDDYPRPCNQT